MGNLILWFVTPGLGSHPKIKQQYLSSSSRLTIPVHGRKAALDLDYRFRASWSVCTAAYRLDSTLV